MLTSTSPSLSCFLSFCSNATSWTFLSTKLRLPWALGIGMELSRPVGCAFGWGSPGSCDAEMALIFAGSERVGLVGAVGCVCCMVGKQGIKRSRKAEIRARHHRPRRSSLFVLSVSSVARRPAQPASHTFLPASPRQSTPRVAFCVPILLARLCAGTLPSQWSTFPSARLPLQLASDDDCLGLSGASKHSRPLGEIPEGGVAAHSKATATGRRVAEQVLMRSRGSKTSAISPHRRVGSEPIPRSALTLRFLRWSSPFLACAPDVPGDGAGLQSGLVHRTLSYPAPLIP